MGTIPYEPFGLKVGKLRDLVWASVREPSEDGDRWFVEEEEGTGYSFEVSLSETERNTTPKGTAPIERDGFPTEAEIKDAIRRAIESALVSPGYKNIKPGSRHRIRVTCFDLYTQESSARGRTRALDLTPAQLTLLRKLVDKANSIPEQYSRQFTVTQGLGGAPASASFFGAKGSIEGVDVSLSNLHELKRSH